MLVDTSFSLNVVAQDLMLSLAGYQAEQLAREDGVFKLTRRSIGGGSIQNYEVDIDGTITSLDTNG